MDDKLDYSDSKILGVTWLGLATNLLLAVLKGIAGVLAHSSVMVADAIHSFSDLLSDGVALWAIFMARKPKDADHPYGYGRFETLGALFIAILLMITGIGIALHALELTENPPIPGNLALWAAGLSIVVKEGMYHATVIVGNRSNSKVLIANAWHHRSDAISSIVALIGIAAAQSGYPLVDPIAAILVAALIIKMGFEIGFESVRELTDKTVEKEVLQNIETLLDNIKSVVHYHQIRARKMGPYMMIDLHVEVDSTLSISAGHQIAEHVRSAILNQLSDQVNEVLVHIDAEKDIEEMDPSLMRPQLEIEADICQALKHIPEIKGISHIRCHYLSKKISVQIEIIVDEHLRIFEVQKIAAQAKVQVQQIPDIDEVDIHLEIADLHVPLPQPA